MAAAAGAVRPASKPNILLIITDQQTVQAMSAAGNPYLRTPAMDRIAREGTRFANSWCTSPVCSPARASLITGCMPHTARVDYLGQRLNPAVPTLGEIFRDAGYETAWAGKWHLPTGLPGAQVPEGGPIPADQRGFQFLPLANKERAQLPFGDFMDTPIAESAAAFLRQKHERPFVLGVSLYNPHDICYWIAEQLPAGHSASGYAVPRERDLPPLPPNFARSADEPEFISRCRLGRYFGAETSPAKNWDELRWRQYLYVYYRLTEQVDRQVAIVLEALRHARLDENTIVVFTSDHGEGMAAHQWVMKLMLYQEPLSVPLVFRWKGHIPQNRVNHRALVSGMDVLPTLCDLAGITLPQLVHGVSLRRSLDGAADPPRDSVFAHLAPEMKDKSMQGRAVRTERFKYVAFSWGRNPEMLFDLEADPGETRNLVSSGAARRELERARALLDRWIKETRDNWKSA